MPDPSPPPPARLASRVRPWMLVLVLSLVYLTSAFVQSGGDPLAFVHLPQPPSEEYPEGTEGYDGQFVYYIAVNPLTSPPHLDIPAYRLQRILLPVLAHVLALGQVAAIPWALLLINLAALIGGVIVLEKLLAAAGASPWWAVTYGLSAGVFMSVRASLTEPLCYGLVILAVWFVMERRSLLAGAILFALAGLAKEPALIFGAGAALWLAFERRWRDALQMGVIAWAPYLIWQGVLLAWLGEIGAGPGGALRTPFEIIPFMGFIRIYLDTRSLAVFLAFAAVIVPVVIGPAVWGLIATVRDVLGRRWHLTVFLLLANAAAMAIIPFSTYREPLGILRVLPGLTVSYLLYAACLRRQRMLRFSLIWLSTLAFAAISG